MLCHYAWGHSLFGLYILDFNLPKNCVIQTGCRLCQGNLKTNWISFGTQFAGFGIDKLSIEQEWGGEMGSKYVMS